MVMACGRSYEDVYDTHSLAHQPTPGSVNNE